MYVYIRKYIWRERRVCVYIYIGIGMCIHIHIYIHTHTSYHAIDVDKIRASRLYSLLGSTRQSTLLFSFSTAGTAGFGSFTA